MFTGNFVAQLVLVGAILSSLALLFVRRPEQTAVNIWIGGMLFLPCAAGIKLPFFSALDRNTLPTVILFATYCMRRPKVVAKSRLGRGLDAMFLVCMAMSIGTVLTNKESIAVAKYRPDLIAEGLTMQDAFADARDDLLHLMLPFVLGRLLVRNSEQARHVLKAFAVGGLIYVPLILFELRMSPLLQTWIYGARPGGSFEQILRGGGFRPEVFMPHGLAVAIFMTMAVFSAFTLAKLRQRFHGISWRPLAIGLLVILVLCKSTGTIAYAALIVPLLVFGKPRRQMRVATLLAGLFLFYPLLREANLVPTEAILSAAESLAGPERAESLGTRLHSEEALLFHMKGKMAFGWGGYGRSTVYSDYGQPQSIFDGFWITMLCHRGVIFLTALSLAFGWPVVKAGRRLARVADKDDRTILCGLSLMMGVGLLDLVPNAMLINYPLLLAGAITGFTRSLLAPGGSAAKLRDGPAAEGGGTKGIDVDPHGVGDRHE